MKLEIDLDLNQIDYDAINKQIQDKIAQMDLREEYQISNKIDNQIRKQTEDEVGYYFRGGTWNGLNDSSKKEIKDEITKTIETLVKPHVENIFNQISQDELNDIISDLLPKVLMETINSSLRAALKNYYSSEQSKIVNLCEQRIRNVINRR